MTGRPEILAPAGSMEGVYAAVRCGADGVYTGGRDFSARASAVNLSDEELKTASDYCHLHGVKIYRAMNIMLFDRELPEFAGQLAMTARAGFDGVILQDIGGAALAMEIVPGLPRHASTQMTVHTPGGAALAKTRGFCRVVPARELTMENIRDICEEEIQTEVFVHGAMCMCLSGQCTMSAVIGSRSANRGRCAQSCRLPFCAGKYPGKANGSSGGKFDLSLKDMSLVSYAGGLAAAGVDSFKIEGRMKRPEYAAAAVTALRNALEGKTDLAEEDMRILRAVFSRSGFSDGYLTGNIGSEMFGSRTKEDVTAAKDVLAQLAALYRQEKKDCLLDMTLTLHPGEPVRLDFSAVPGDNFANAFGKPFSINGSVSGDVPEGALHREFTEADGEKYLSKLGDTRFIPGKISCDIAPGLALPAAAVNELRRRACTEADRRITEMFTPEYEIIREPPEDLIKRLTAETASASGETEYRVITDDTAAAMAVQEISNTVIFPAELCGSLMDIGFPIEKLTARLPDIVTDETALVSLLTELCRRGVTRFFANNFTHLGTLSMLRERVGDIRIHGGWGLNIANSLSMRAAADMEVSDVCLSFEMKAGQISAVSKPVPAGIYAYGRLPLMTVRNCPVKAERGGCRDCPHSLCDPAGRVFPVYCGSDKSYARVHNCDILNVCDKLTDFSGISFVIIDLTGERAGNAADIVSRCRQEEKPRGKYTRGLYYRGII